MPNIASILKEEITRLARKEVRGETEGLKKSAAQYRSEIAALKRRLSGLEQQTARLAKALSKTLPTPLPADDAATKFRYSAKGFRALRQRLDLSAADLGTLLNVSAQTIYNWEAETTRPRQQQLAAIAAVRRLGKRAIAARLGEQAAPASEEAAAA